MNYIEKILDKKTTENPEGRKYFKQWEIAKDYLPQYLQLVGHVFPHYSLHDTSHSETILNNIIKILGTEVIEQFSIVDLWLLLSAAYYHDCGMVISGNEEIDFLEKESDFIEYVRKIQNDKQSSMHDYSKEFVIKDGKLWHEHNEITAKSIDAFKFLIADFTRSSHAQRSSSRIQSSASLHLPGNPIPERIIKILGLICYAHSWNRDKVMEIPDVESSGCGIEDCHPKYIAFLLRIGDLHDVDTNRVSSVLLSSIASIPADSTLFNQSNRDITHIRIDRSVIEMTAQCSNYEVAKLVNNWFVMIDEEITYQTKYWYRIAPSVEYGNLPSVGAMIVKLANYDDISGTDNFRFKIDSSKAIELLQGAGLYSDSSQCVRELLQNAVDATYLRVFLEHPDIKDIAEFIKYCKERPIKVSLNKKRVEQENAVWEMVIQDQGIGLEKSDLTFLTCTGSSDKNNAKRKIIESMPAWMRPSGTFGIGFQSVFLLTDKVYVTTKKRGKDETLTLEMFNPAGKEKGTILINSTFDGNLSDGTTIKFEMLLPIQSGWTVNSENRISIAEINSYDFAKDDSFDIKAAKLMDEVLKFSRMSYVDLELNYKGEQGKLSSQQVISTDYYDEETGMQVCLMGIGSSYNGLYYRNQPVEKYKMNLPLLNFAVNILAGDAKELLTLNRNDILETATSHVRHDIGCATCRYLIKKINNLSNEDQKPYAAAYLMSNYDFIKKHIDDTFEVPDDWKMLKVICKDNTEMTIEQLLNYEKVVITEHDHMCFYDVNGSEIEFDIHKYGQNIDVIAFLQRILHKHFQGFYYSANGVIFTKDSQEDYIENTENARIKWLKSYLTCSLSSSRGMMPCLKSYIPLAVNVHQYDFTFNEYHVDYPEMVCPYIRSAEGSSYTFFVKQKLEYNIDDKVIDFVYNNRKHKDVTRDEIVNTYKLFEEDFRPAFESINAPSKDGKMGKQKPHDGKNEI